METEAEEQRKGGIQVDNQAKLVWRTDSEDEMKENMLRDKFNLSLDCNSYAAKTRLQ